MKENMLMTKQYRKKVNVKSSGFTLIELLLVLTIVGFMAATTMSVFLIYNKKQKIYLTKARLDQIHESMQKFLVVNGRYPCPTPFTLRPEDANFGLEGNSSATAAAGGQSCRTGGGTVPIAGTVLANVNPIIGHVRIGVVPVRTLNLPDEYAVDAWGGTLTYAVMRRLATQNTFLHSGGGISITDASGLNIINPSDSAHYIILSHGPDQNGARVIESNNINHLKNPCGGGTQSENCNDDRRFSISTSFIDIGADQSDDIAIFEVQRRKDDILERGTILAFDSSACPQGWSDYMNDTERGRFLLGLKPSGTAPRDLMSPAANPKTAPVVNPVSRGVLTGEYFLGDIGEYGTENIPAYLALRYCIKQ